VVRDRVELPTFRFSVRPLPDSGLCCFCVGIGDANDLGFSPGGPGLPGRLDAGADASDHPRVTCSPASTGPPGRSYSSGLACRPVVTLGFWVEEERDDAVNEDAVSPYRKQSGRYAEAAGYETCLADVVGCAIGQHVGERC